MNSESQFGSGQFLTLRDILTALWRGKWWLLAVTISAAVLSIVLSLKMPDLYTAEAVLSPKDSSSSDLIPGQLGGLASLAGINMSGGESNRTQVALEILKSRRFINEFIKRYELSVPLIAAIGWDHQSNKLKIDETLYDPGAQAWIRDVSYPYTQIPSEWELYKAFIDIMTIEQNPETGMVTLSIEFLSPHVSAQWANRLVDDINQEMRQRDREQAQRSIEYLTKEIETTQIASMREAFSSLVEEQHKNKMLAEVTPDYAFTVIDPPVASELKSAPTRSLIVIAVTFIVAFLSAIVIVVVNTAGTRD